MFKARMIRYLMWHGGMGMLLGWAGVLIMVLTNQFGLTELMRQANLELVGAFMMCIVTGTLTASLQMGLGVMALSEDPGLMPEWLKQFFRKLGGAEA